MSRKTKNLEKGFSLVLKANPEVLSRIVEIISSEFKWEELECWSMEETKTASPDYRKILICVRKTVDGSIASEDCIGIVELVSGGQNLTSFRIPPRSKWHINIAPKTLPFLDPEKDISGISSNKFGWFYNETYFYHLLDSLCDEFQKLGYMETRLGRLWRWLKEIKERIPSIRII
jgi:hypothetical protein